MRYIVNDCTDAVYNLDFERRCLEQMPLEEPYFWLWRNAPSVIIGHNQVAEAEVNMDYLRANGIALVRRSTGGGAVYHDLGNLNYSFIRPLRGGETVPEGVLRDPAVEMVARALRQMDVPAEIGGRNDIFVEGRKVSGFAKRIWRDRVLVHGTLMYDVDLDVLSRVLDTPGSKLNRKGVASVRSRVANLKLYLPQYPTIESFAAALHSILRRG